MSDLFGSLFPVIFGGKSKSSLLSGLSAYWKMDESSDGSGLVTRADSVGLANLTDHGNTPSVAGLLGNAASFVATSSQEFTVTNAIFVPGANSFEYATWVKVSIAQITYLFSNWNSANWFEAQNYFCYIWASGAITFDALTSTPSEKSVTLPVTSVPFGEFVCIFCGYDASIDKIFIQVNDGTRTIQSDTMGGAINTGAGALHFGRYANTYGTGIVDNVGFWGDRVLTAAERLLIYNSGAGNSYPFSSPADTGVALGTSTYSSAIGV